MPNNEMENPFERPLYVMLKPVGATCNLACEYCYYLEKSGLYRRVPNHLLSESLLERFVEQYIGSQTMRDVMFTWHGGEALLRPLSFYRKAVALQKKYAHGHNILNCLQTNGILLNDEWCRFFKDEGWLIGISIDGPERFHDEYRRSRGGQPTFARVMRGIELLKKHGVEWNGMAVVNDYNGDYPLEFYHFFKDIECRYLQFTPIVERMVAGSEYVQLASLATREATEVADFSVSPRQWGDFLCAIFDEWVRNDVGRYYVQLFDATLANYAGVEPGVCSMARTCGHAGVMEFNGDVYSCDHFVFPEYLLGNIGNSTLAEMMYSQRQSQFGAMKRGSLPRQCRECKFSTICNGECPKNRFATTADGEPGLNYLCQGYYKFFEHSAPYMEFMKRELDAQRPPANVMNLFK